MPRRFEGPAFYCGDHVNTDVMSPGRYEPYGGPDELARIALVDYEADPPFVDPATGRSRYVVIVAGRDFGCGSSRESAPQALFHAGARVVIARSFARIFFRNCVNMGLLIPIAVDHPFGPEVLDAEVTVDLDERVFTVSGRSFEIPDFGPIGAIIDAGGLLPYHRLREARP